MTRLTYQDCLARLKNLEGPPPDTDKTDKRGRGEASVSFVSSLREENQEYFDPLADPRPDLDEDSHLWAKVLERARRSNQDVHGVLHGFRCMGARLLLSDAGLKMEPRVHDGENPQAYEFHSREQYLQLRRRWLLPMTDEVSAIFKSAAEELLGRHEPGSR